jgi:ribosome-associated toxin RatA of RatAB toxin-antitoxin module
VKLGGKAQAEVDAPVAEVWALLADVLAAPSWQSGVLSVSALDFDSEGRPSLVESQVDVTVRHLTSQVRFSYEPETSLSWVQEAGDLKSLHGEWTLEPLEPERTQASFSIEADPGRLLGIVIRPVESLVSSMLVEARPRELKQHFESRRRG